MPTTVTIRIYEELNDFLSRYPKKKPFEYSFLGNPSVKDIIESIGIPHSEVDLILVNGQSVSFNHHPAQNDHISVYPVFESIDISSVTLLRPEPLREPAFIADVHLGRLARYLRMLGMDTLYRNNLEDEEIISLAAGDQRIILTRDVAMLKNGRVTHGYCVRSSDPYRQLTEVIQRFDLKKSFRPFHRCTQCNEVIQKVEKSEVNAQLKPRTRKYYDEFFRCTGCGKIYWKGSHFWRMQKLVEIMNHESTNWVNGSQIV